MIRVSAMYPHTPNSKFDLDYYAQKHMALVTSRLKPMGLQRFEVDKGIGTAAPGDPAPFVAIGHLYITALDDFQKAFGTPAQEIMADIPNFTDIEPQFQISEVIG